MASNRRSGSNKAARARKAGSSHQKKRQSTKQTTRKNKEPVINNGKHQKQNKQKSSSIEVPYQQVTGCRKQTAGKPDDLSFPRTTKASDQPALSTRRSSATKGSANPFTYHAKPSVCHSKASFSFPVDSSIPKSKDKSKAKKDTPNATGGNSVETETERLYLPKKTSTGKKTQQASLKSSGEVTKQKKKKTSASSNTPVESKMKQSQKSVTVSGKSTTAKSVPAATSVNTKITPMESKKPQKRSISRVEPKNDARLLKKSPQPKNAPVMAAKKSTKAKQAKSTSASLDGGQDTWVQCESCEKWRRLQCHVDQSILPMKWYCRLNKGDPERSTCAAPEEDWSESSDCESEKDLAMDETTPNVEQKQMTKSRSRFAAAKSPLRPDAGSIFESAKTGHSVDRRAAAMEQTGPGRAKSQSEKPTSKDKGEQSEESLVAETSRDDRASRRRSFFSRALDAATSWMTPTPQKLVVKPPPKAKGLALNITHEDEVLECDASISSDKTLVDFGNRLQKSKRSSATLTTNTVTSLPSTNHKKQKRQAAKDAENVQAKTAMMDGEAEGFDEVEVDSDKQSHSSHSSTFLSSMHNATSQTTQTIATLTTRRYKRPAKRAPGAVDDTLDSPEDHKDGNRRSKSPVRKRGPIAKGIGLSTTTSAPTTLVSKRESTSGRLKDGIQRNAPRGTGRAVYHLDGEVDAPDDMSQSASFDFDDISVVGKGTCTDWLESTSSYNINASKAKKFGKRSGAMQQMISQTPTPFSKMSERRNSRPPTDAHAQNVLSSAVNGSTEDNGSIMSTELIRLPAGTRKRANTANSNRITATNDDEHVVVSSPEPSSLSDYDPTAYSKSLVTVDLMDECCIAWIGLFSSLEAQRGVELPEKVPVIIWDRRPRECAYLTTRAAQNTVEGLSADQIEYYVHFKGQDNRLDRWISYDVLDLTTLKKATAHQKRVEESCESIGVKSVEKIVISEWESHAWYDSPFPQKYNCETLYFCDFCLARTVSQSAYFHHAGTCQCRCPPGKSIYRDGGVAVFEVDGETETSYCERLCLLSKLFLDHKTICYDVERFNFYIATKIDIHGAHLVGYFSKEKASADNCNVSCIFTLPQYQRDGYGKFLISLSYELTKREKTTGSPEKPLSESGERAYLDYWKHTIFIFLATHGTRRWKPTVLELSTETGIHVGDLATAIHSVGGSIDDNGHVVFDPAVIVNYTSSEKCGRFRLVKPECLDWQMPHTNDDNTESRLTVNGKRSTHCARSPDTGTVVGVDGITYYYDSQMTSYDSGASNPLPLPSFRSRSVNPAEEVAINSSSASVAAAPHKKDESTVSYDHWHCLAGNDLPDFGSDEEYSPTDVEESDNESTLDDEDTHPPDISWFEESLLLKLLGKETCSLEELRLMMNVPADASHDPPVIAPSEASHVGNRPVNKLVIRYGNVRLESLVQNGKFREVVEHIETHSSKSALETLAAPHAVSERIYLLWNEFFEQVGAGLYENVLKATARGYTLADMEEAIASKVQFLRRTLRLNRDDRFLFSPRITPTLERKHRYAAISHRRSERAAVVLDDHQAPQACVRSTLPLQPMIRRISPMTLPCDDDFRIWRVRNTYLALLRLQAALSFLRRDETELEIAEKVKHTYVFATERFPVLTDDDDVTDREDALKLFAANKEHTIRCIGQDAWNQLFLSKEGKSM